MRLMPSLQRLLALVLLLLPSWQPASGSATQREPYLFNWATSEDLIQALDSLSYELHKFGVVGEQSMHDIKVDDGLIGAIHTARTSVAQLDPADPDEDPHNYGIQINILLFINEVWAKTVEPLRDIFDDGDDHGWKDQVTRASHSQLAYVKAMLSTIQVRVPVCLYNPTCVVDKASMVLWRLANTDPGLLEAGAGWDFFQQIKAYLPAHARWRSPWQCPPKVFPGLQAQPFWRLEDLPEGSAARRLVTILRERASDIEEDLQSGILSPQGLAMIRDPAWTGLHHGGGWMAFTIYRTAGFHGRMQVPRELDPLHCRIAHRTCKILREAGVPPGMLHKLPSLQASQEVVDFLKADPGVIVNFHAASVNTRLTVQLCLTGCNPDGPDPETGGSYIEVGRERKYYRRGEPFVFDDSFLHRVIMDPNAKEPRWVLSVQIMHPSLDTPEAFADHLSSHPKGEDDSRNWQTDGVAPPAFSEAESKAQSAWIPAGEAFFVHHLRTPVMLYNALWGPDDDGPALLIGEAVFEADRPHSGGMGLALPALAHRSRLWAVNITDGEELGAWRIDARVGGLRRFELPMPEEEVRRRKLEGL